MLYCEYGTTANEVYKINGFSRGHFTLRTVEPSPLLSYKRNTSKADNPLIPRLPHMYLGMHRPQRKHLVLVKKKATGLVHSTTFFGQR